MSIKARVEDAEALWASGRVEGAWVQGLIAAAATARKRYPKPKKDNEAFKAFICDIARTIVTGKVGGPGPTYIKFYSDNRANHRTLEGILYHELRCNLIHEAELKEVGFSKSVVKNGLLEATMRVPTRGQAEIPDFWLLRLISAIKAAPENRDEFTGL